MEGPHMTTQTTTPRPVKVAYTVIDTMTGDTYPGIMSTSERGARLYFAKHFNHPFAYTAILDESEFGGAFDDAELITIDTETSNEVPATRDEAVELYFPETVYATIDDETSTETTHTPTVAILASLDRALAFIRETHPDVPTGIALTIENGRGKAHGHFHASQWEDIDSAGSKLGKRHELTMASDSLNRGAESALTTLIHEAGHALAHNTGVKDTSRQGRYHGDKFRTIAEGMGLTCAKDSKIGTITTGLNTWAKAHYAEVLADLESVLTTYRVPTAAKDKAPKTTIRVQCGCETPVTVPIKWWDDFGADNLICSLCEDANEDRAFHPVAE